MAGSPSKLGNIPNLTKISFFSVRVYKICLRGFLLKGIKKFVKKIFLSKGIIKFVLRVFSFKVVIKSDKKK